jgi:hypothetical protein
MTSETWDVGVWTDPGTIGISQFDEFALPTTNAQTERADFCWVPSGGMESAEHEGSEPSEGQHVFWFARVMPYRGNCLGV